MATINQQLTIEVAKLWNLPAELQVNYVNID